MPYSSTNGYTPDDIDTILQSIMANINIQFSETYTYNQFQGTNFYKYIYAIAQDMQKNEVKTSEIFIKLQGYFAQINAKIARPSVTPKGTVDALAAPTVLTPAGYLASVKAIGSSDAGKRFVCVDINSGGGSYAAQKLEICTIISQCTPLGIVTQGTEVSTIVASNGQSFDWKYALPNYIPVALRLTLTLSVNNQFVILDDDTIKQNLMANIAARYKLGLDFAPEKYFNIQDDAPWCSQVLLEWTTDVTAGVLNVSPTWHSTVFTANYNDKYVVALGLISVVED